MNFLKKTFGILLISVLTAGSAFAAKVAFWSTEYTASQFAAILPEHTVSSITTSGIDAGELSSFDVLITGHVDPDAATTATCNKIRDFLNAGKGIVAEWNSSTMLFQPSVGAYYAFSNPCNLFSGQAAGGQPMPGHDGSISVTNPLSPLMLGLPASFGMGGGSQYVYALTGFGAEWVIDATFTDGTSVYPAVMHARPASGGAVAVSPFDFFDVAPSGVAAVASSRIASGLSSPQALTNEQAMTILLNNMVNWVANPNSTGTASVPTMSQWGLAVMFALMSLASAALLRHRQI